MKFINLLNIRQNVLIKNVLGIKYYSRAKPLLNVLKIEQVHQLYMKHKLFGVRQFSKNQKSNDILEYLVKYYNRVKPTKLSFISQLDQVTKFTGMHWKQNFKECMNAIDEKFISNDIELINKIKKIIDSYIVEYSFICIRELNDFLYADSGLR